MISENSKIIKCPGLMESVIDKEAVILGPDKGKYIGLNEIGTEIWSRLDQAILVSDLIITLSDIYAEDKTIIKEHVIEFLNDLLNKSFIKDLDETQS